MNIKPNKHHLNEEETKQAIEKLKEDESKGFSICHKCNQLRSLTYKGDSESAVMFINYQEFEINRAHCQVIVCNECAKSKDFDE